VIYRRVIFSACESALCSVQLFIPLCIRYGDDWWW